MPPFHCYYRVKTGNDKEQPNGNEKAGQKNRTAVLLPGTAGTYSIFPFVLLHFRQARQGQQDREHEAEGTGAERRNTVPSAPSREASPGHSR